MNIPVPLIFVVFVWLSLIISARSRDLKRKREAKEKAFWEKEHEANFARARPIDDLAYITVPLDTLPFGALETEEIAAVETQIRTLSEEKILNLTGISNTDLKLQYGAAHITALTAYDANFTALVSALQKWGKALADASLYREADAVLSFAVFAGSDVSATYKLLAELILHHLGLSEEAQRTRLETLLAQAKELNSLTQPQLVAHLDSILHQI